MEDKKECLVYAETAFANKQYLESLVWYKKALEIDPKDLHILSRAGAICVGLNRFADALTFFRKAKELDPQNGDNLFNYGNACFFNNDYAQAFSSYVDAEKLGCSEDVLPRLYYQMALLCSMRQDTKSALIYLSKCEDSDTTGLMSLNPDLISEKLKLYLLVKDYDNAERYAAQLVAISPTEFKNYMVHFSICMMHNHFDAAQKLLYDAKAYAQLSADDSVSVVLQNAALYTARADAEPSQKETYCNNAITLLSDTLKDEAMTDAHRIQLLMALAEAYCKAQKYDFAIVILNQLLGIEPLEETKEMPVAEEDVPDLLPSEVEELIESDFERLDELQLTGMGEFGTDDAGIEVMLLDPDILYGPQATDDENEENPGKKIAEALSAEDREKVVFMLLSCHMEQDDFMAAQKMAGQLKGSQNKYYEYFALYVDALAHRKLTGDSLQTQEKYARALAFFRSKSFADSSDALACVFRARLYAEQGSFVKAEELAKLLPEEDRDTLLAYIKTCKEM